MDQKNYANSGKIKEQSITLLFLLVVGLLLFVSTFISIRFDLTRNNIYTISDVSQEIIKDIEDKVYIDYYLTPSLSVNNEEPQQIIDLLQEYSVRSKGKVVFTLYDTTKDGMEKKIQQYNLEAKQVQVIEKDQASYAIVYSGIVIQYKNRQRILPFVLQASSIEYQVTSKILEVYNDDEAVIGILALDNELNYEQDLEALQQVLGNDARIERVELDTEISNNIDALFVIGGNLIDNDTAYYLDQFIMSGRGVFFAVDRGHVSLQQGINVFLQDNLLFDMLDHYGVEVEEKLVADELNKFIPTNERGFQRLSPYALWITADKRYVNKEHPLTANFGGLDSYWTSPLKASNEDVEFISLIESSPKSWTISPSVAPPNGEDAHGTIPQTFPAVPDPSNFVSYRNSTNEGKKTIVAALQGNMESAVEAGLITRPQEASTEAYLSSTDKARFLITGNINMLTGLYRFTNASYNFLFISSAADWLGSNQKLQLIKSRVARNINLTKIVDNKQKSTLILLVKILTMVVIPLVIIISAFLILSYRNNLSKRKY